MARRPSVHRKSLIPAAPTGGFCLCFPSTGSFTVTNFASKTWDMLRLISRGGPALCNVAVTNACNAACDFCNFARGKVGSSNLRWIDAGQFGRALDILRKRDIRYISFFGGEPLLLPKRVLEDLWAWGFERNGRNSVQTNGVLIDDEPAIAHKVIVLDGRTVITGSSRLRQACWSETDVYRPPASDVHPSRCGSA